MPVLLKRKNGELTAMRNAEYIPFYYFIPKSILQKCGAELNSIPRRPKAIIHSRTACELIESDLFRLLIVDAAAYMVWHFMGFNEYMEVYSGYDPAWKLAHIPEYWIREMTDAGFLPVTENLFKNCDDSFGYISEEEISDILSVVVPSAMERYNMNSVIEAAREFRCFEDFDFRDSRQKTDFYRKWYHTRTKHPMISLEEFQARYREQHDGAEWDIPDERMDLESDTVSKTVVEDFMKRLSEKDRQMLKLRMLGHTYKDIADLLGYQTHSAVLKRIQKIGKTYERFTGSSLGFE